MSTSIEDLIDYNLVKKCSKCEFVKLIFNFHFRKDTRRYRNECQSCRYEKQKEWNSNNIEKRKKKQKM